MEEIPFFRGYALDTIFCQVGRVVHSHQPGQVSAGAHLLVDLIGDLPRFIPFRNIWLDFGGNPFSDFGTEGSM